MCGANQGGSWLCWAENTYRRCEMYKKILLADDGSEGAKKALEAGISLVKVHQA